MQDWILHDFYVAQTMYQDFARDALNDLDPSVAMNIAAYAGTPDGVYGAEQAQEMRVFPERRETIYETVIDQSTFSMLESIDHAARTEIDYLSFLTALGEYSGNPAPVAENIRASRQRLSRMASMIDEIQYEADDEPNWITARLDELVTEAKPRHLETLQRGRDAGTISRFMRERLAGEYLNASNTSIEPVGYSAAYIVLRLTADPATRGDDMHLAALQAIRHQKACSQTLLDLAVDTVPTLKYARHITSERPFAPKIN